MLHSKTEVPVVIRAIRDPSYCKDIISPAQGRWMFILGGSIDTVAQSVAYLHRHQWKVFVHIDMVKGITSDFEGIRFFKEFANPEGIITTRQHNISHAKKLNLFSIQRVFLLDSQSIESGISQVQHGDADAVEVLPGILPEVISYFSRNITKPLIAGGLVTTEKHVKDAIRAGAISVSSSNSELCKKQWNRSDLQLNTDLISQDGR